ncbi:hypothetical protein [Clostridium sp. Cult3]|uniref:hypothetical protein n=1 Tax=Clostridium sp. Cult3 TaxID=2079004 RepID=UPI001F3AF047|nr:hypothetical protein [Clostridium sp. Cult3]MCF6459540.1 hypothetical protein [Clostridium sp. Cult3]
MKVYILDEILKYENCKSILDDMFKEIEHKVSSSNLVFSHFIIDGFELYDDFYDYFLDNIRNIKEVEVITKTIKEISQDIIITTIDYYYRAIPEIEILANEFYKTTSRESWHKLMALVEGVKWIMDTFVAIDTNPQLQDIVRSYEGWNRYAKDVYSLQEIMLDFEDVLENSDFVSTADLLSYKIAPLFKEMKGKLEQLVLEEVAMDKVES